MMMKSTVPFDADQMTTRINHLVVITANDNTEVNVGPFPDYNSAGADRHVPSDRNARNDAGADTERRVFPDSDIAGQGTLRRDMHAATDVTVVIDSGAGVQDGQIIDPRLRVDHHASHDDHAVTNDR